jgi:hypothetical protein
MADELTPLSAKISATEQELQALKGNISVIERGGDDLAKEHGYSTRIAALENLRAEKVELLKKENLLRQQQQQQQQQQSGAGTSMLPVRSGLVLMLPSLTYAQTSCFSILPFCSRYHNATGTSILLGHKVQTKSGGVQVRAAAYQGRSSRAFECNCPCVKNAR